MLWLQNLAIEVGDLVLASEYAERLTVVRQRLPFMAVCCSHSMGARANPVPVAAAHFLRPTYIPPDFRAEFMPPHHLYHCGDTTTKIKRCWHISDFKSR